MSTTFLQVKNRAYSTLASAIADDALSLDVASGDGAKFPSSYPFHITIDSEIMSCTNRSTDTLTVTRAQQSTTAATHSAGARVSLNVTAKSISDLNTAVNTLEVDVPTYVAKGDVRYASAAGTGAILTVGADNRIMAVATDVPAWKTPAAIMADLSGQAAAEFLFNTQKVGGIVDPTTNQQAATKKYADDAIVADIATHASDIDAHVSGATAGQLLVATGAATAAIQSTGVVLSAPDISGVVTAASPLTLPTFTAGGAITEGKFGTSVITANAAGRGKFYLTEGGAGVADLLYCVLKGADDNYSAIQAAIG